MRASQTSMSVLAFSRTSRGNDQRLVNCSSVYVVRSTLKCLIHTSVSMAAFTMIFRSVHCLSGNVVLNFPCGLQGLVQNYVAAPLPSLMVIDASKRSRTWSSMGRGSHAQCLPVFVHECHNHLQRKARLVNLFLKPYMQVCLHGLKNGHDVGPPLSMYRRQQPWGVHLALLCVVTQVQWPEWTSSWTGFGNPAVVVVLGLRVSLVARGVWTPGRQPWKVGSFWCVRVPVAQLLAGATVVRTAWYSSSCVRWQWHECCLCGGPFAM
jgi:hypothetical protein